MGKDTPDWGGWYNGILMHPLSDMAELAVRLGSPIIHDRAGNVIWYYDFELGLDNVVTYKTSANKVISIQTNYVDWGAFALQLDHALETTGYMQVYKDIQYLGPSRYGVAFSMIQNDEVQEHSFFFNIVEDTTFIKFGVQYDRPNAKLHYWGSGNAWVEFADNVADPTSSILFQKYKIVVDTTLRQYYKFTMGRVIYDLRDIDAFTATDTDGEYMRLMLQSETTGVGASSVYLDHMILTMNEPPTLG